MLRPQDTATRERKRLDGRWDFTLDAEGVGRAQRWFTGRLPNPIAMAVPASYNDLLPDEAVRDHVGDVWYQRLVRVPRGWSDQRILLRFESATHRATVWVNEQEVVSHEGGYTPFEADLTGLVPPGQEIRITICVNNVLSFQSIPPGVLEVAPSGAQRQHYWHDFFNYAGIHRSVWLHTTPRAYIDDVTVVTGLSGTTGTVDYAVDVVGAAPEAVRVILRRDGAEVASLHGQAAGRLSIDEVTP